MNKIQSDEASLFSADTQKNFTRILKRNIILPLGVGVLSAVVFIALTFYLLSVLGWVEHTERVISNVNDAEKLSVTLESSMRGFLITGDESFLSNYEVSKPQIKGRMDSLIDLVNDNPAQVDRFKNIQSLQMQWETFAQDMNDLRRKNGNYQEAIRSGRGKSIFDEIHREFADAINMERQLLLERNVRAKQAISWVVGIYLVLSLILGALLAMLGRRDLLNLSGTYNKVLEKHTEHAAFLQQQAWLKSGQNQLNEIIIDQVTPEAVGSKALEFFARYLEITVGAFYVRAENGLLQRVASYGFERTAEQSGQSFQLAESLVGQAAKENRLLLIKDVPHDYLKIVSGLGSTAPRNIAVLPFFNEGSVNGVVELGFMGGVGQLEQDFLQLIAPVVGTSIGAALYRQQLQNILAETQQLNEELQVQQEELRTANEELEEQSSLLEESQSSLENQKAELEQTNDQLTDQAMALDQKNAALNKAQMELEKHAEKLQQASRYKSEFLANMSHELRTPLNSSLILAKLLADNQKGNLSDEQVKFAQTIYSSGNDLLNLINDILDISKVEAGKLDLTPERIVLTKLADNLESVFAPLAQQKNLDFSVEIASAAPGFIISDLLRVEQILKNLLSNALKFTGTGSIALVIRSEQNSNVSFSVTDSGIGIEPDQQDIIFEAFQQADGTISRRYGGTGLGLSISRDLATLLGGAIHVSSVPGKGSTFSLVLPEKWDEQPLSTVAGNFIQPPALHPIVAEPPAPVYAPEMPELPAFPDDRNSTAPHMGTILIIEDEPAFAMILFELAHELQFRCLVAQDAKEGLMLANAFRPDAIVLDVRLPDRSGLSVLDLLKENLETRHIPVHVVSGTERTDPALHLGAIGHAMKPITRERLKEVFHKLKEKFTQKIKRVLLVEDDERQRNSVVHLIGDDDVRITAVALGEHALELLRTTVFDCMIIDLKLPDIQGQELLRRMSEEDICSFPPVIVYTGRNLTREEEAELMKYSRSIIIKGARSPERLLDEVTLFLHKVESQLSSTAQNMLRTVRSRDRIFEGRKILLVDDDVRNIFALTSALEQKGIAIEIGRNGFEAIKKLDEVPDIDLILMDVMMPGMDGLEATRRIRQDARFQKLPIIAVTAKAMKDDQEQCLAAGATDYLAKPVDLDRLYSLLRVWMPHLERYAE